MRGCLLRRNLDSFPSAQNYYGRTHECLLHDGIHHGQSGGSGNKDKIQSKMRNCTTDSTRDNHSTMNNMDNKDSRTRNKGSWHSHNYMANLARRGKKVETYSRNRTTPY